MLVFVLMNQTEGEIWQNEIIKDLLSSKSRNSANNLPSKSARIFSVPPEPETFNETLSKYDVSKVAYHGFQTMKQVKLETLFTNTNDRREKVTLVYNIISYLIGSITNLARQALIAYFRRSKQIK